MSSVADEIVKLHGLMQQGILTPEEFSAAKQALITRTGVAAPAAATSSPFPRSSGAPLQAVDTSLFEESHTGAHLKAYNHLKKIIQNILKVPGDQRYRRLRFENPILQAELFSDPGAEPFLASLRFVYESVKLPDGRCDDVILLSDDKLDEQMLKQALVVLEELEIRDAAAADAAVEFGKLRRSVGLEVRRERWTAAQRAGELEAFVTKEFLADTAGDLLFSSLDSLEVLLTISQNLVDSPSCAKFRALKLSNKRVRRAVCDQRGGLEFLVCVLGFELTSDSISLPFIAAVSADECERLAGGVAMITRIKDVVAAQRLVLLQEQREAAKRAAMDELEAARKEMKPKAASSEKPPGPSSGKRVPIQEALQQLLGRSDLP